jgi:glycosyltransferase involved in cell wall biosynthesis
MSSSKKIVFFYPANKRTVAIETAMIELKKKGHDILLLTTSPADDLHTFLSSKGIQCFATDAKGYFRQLLFLTRFCRSHKIDYVFSHLQPVNFVAVIAQFSMRSKVVVFRHHLQSVHETDEITDVHPNEIRMDKIINRFAKKIVVPSSGVYKGMEKYENVSMSKVLIIPYIYDFSKYQSPDQTAVEEIKKNYPCRLRLIMVSRMVRLKRHHVVFPVIKDLVSEGYDIKLLVLDQGPEKENLENYIREHKLDSAIVMLGYRKDFVNYMAASDLLIQPSLSDASNSVAKEMALFEKPVAVSQGVGDYDDYVKHGENGYLIPVTGSAAHIRNLIIDAYNHPDQLIIMGRLLKKEVISRFDSSRSSEIIALYESLLD